MHDIKGMKAAFLVYSVTRRDGSQGWDMIYGRPVILPEDVVFFFSSAEVFERDELGTFNMSLFLDEETSLNGEGFRAS
jgi:hypothetical protein